MRSSRRRPARGRRSVDFAGPAVRNLAEGTQAREPSSRRGSCKELPQISLADALELTILFARKDPRRHPRVAAPIRRGDACGGGRRRSL